MADGCENVLLWLLFISFIIGEHLVQYCVVEAEDDVELVIPHMYVKPIFEHQQHKFIKVYFALLLLLWKPVENAMLEFLNLSQ